MSEIIHNLHVSYKCENCRHQNKQIAPTKYLNKDRGSRKGYLIEPQKYRGCINEINWKCKCEECGKRPIWSTYPPKWINVSLLIIGFGAIIESLYVLLMSFQYKSSGILPVFLVLFFFGWALLWLVCIINRQKSRKVNELDDEYLPFIEVPDERINHNFSYDWICPKCHRPNAEYVGTCACGTSKSEADELTEKPNILEK